MSNATTWNVGWAATVNEDESSPAADTEAEERAWIAAARNGDRRAFEALIKRHERRVFALAGRFFRRPEDVEDAAQETFLTVWRKLDTYRARAPFEHWLTRVCLNCCYSRLRRERPEEPLDSAGEVAGAKDNPAARVEVERLLARLDPEDRFILQLLHGEGWSVAEIAGRLGWRRSRVKVRAHRARRKLQAILSREDTP